MSNRLSVTYPTAVTLHAIAGGYSYGFDIMDATGLASGTTYPLLRRLESAGCIVARWEDEARARREGRPPRRHYRITADGRAFLARARERFPNLDGALHPGTGAPAGVRA